MLLCKSKKSTARQKFTHIRLWKGTTLRLHGMSWGVKTTCFKAPGFSLGGSGVSIGVTSNWRDQKVTLNHLGGILLKMSTKSSELFKKHVFATPAHQKVFFQRSCKATTINQPEMKVANIQNGCLLATKEPVWYMLMLQNSGGWKPVEGKVGSLSIPLFTMGVFYIQNRWVMVSRSSIKTTPYLTWPWPSPTFGSMHR